MKIQINTQNKHNYIRFIYKALNAVKENFNLEKYLNKKRNLDVIATMRWYNSSTPPSSTKPWVLARKELIRQAIWNFGKIKCVQKKLENGIIKLLQEKIYYRNRKEKL